MSSVGHTSKMLLPIRVIYCYEAEPAARTEARCTALDYKAQ